MSDSELEDGELTSEDDLKDAASVVPSAFPNAENTSRSTIQNAANNFVHHYPPRVDVYRSGASSLTSESETSDSDDEAELWQRKRAKYQQRMLTECPSKFQNPLLTQKEPVLPDPDRSAAGRRVNNIWGAVLSEQTVTRELGMTLTDTSYKESKFYQQDDRDVESYDFTRKYDDDRESIKSEASDKEGELFREVVDLPEPEINSRKRKRVDKPQKRDRHSVKKGNTKSRGHGQIPVTEKDSVRKVANYIKEMLDEPKYYLIERIVHVIGKATALQLLKMTEDVEAAGGVMIKNGTRRRSPGGCYLHLLRNSNKFTLDQMNQIFADEDVKFRKRISLKARRKAKPKSDNTMAVDDNALTSDHNEDLTGELKQNSDNGMALDGNVSSSDDDHEQTTNESKNYNTPEDSECSENGSNETSQTSPRHYVNSEENLPLDETEIVDVPLS